jgi:predicted Zn-dependent peptidase
MTTALDELYGLGYDQIDRDDAQYERVTPHELKAVAARHLGPERAVFAVVKPR